MSAQSSLLDLLETRGGSTRPGPSTWLVTHLVSTGHLTESGVSRRARIRACRCGKPVLVGLDDDTCAFEVHTDPVPLNPLGEMLARLEHRATFDLRREGGGWVLDHRDHRRITARPAGTRPRSDVVREHQCHTRPVSEPEALATSFAETRPRLPAGSAPPF